MAICLFAALPAVSVAAAPDDWTTVNKDYSSQRYVDLNQITPQNVQGLKELCEIDLNEPSTFSSGILKVGRTLYVTTRRMTYAIDATTCQLRWRHVIAEGAVADTSTNNNRGAGYLDGKLFRGDADGRFWALDAATGKTVWTVPFPHLGKNESTVAAPIAWNGKVFMGITTADIGVAGRVAAMDTATGKELWEFQTVPKNGNFFKGYQGGAFWTTFSLDPAKGELFASASNPFFDYNGGQRPGPNLYTNSVLSLDVNTGKLKYFYQALPHDVHDWDLGTAATLYSLGGRDRLSVAGKDGLVYGLDRASQRSIFQTPGTSLVNGSAPFPFNINKDPLNPTTAVRVCPGSLGGAQFTGTSYSPSLHALYIGMNDFCWFYFTELFVGWTQPDLNVHIPPRGWITAMDADSGKVLWQYHAAAQVQAGTVPTSGGLLFAGDTLGNLMAFDAKTGKLLKSIDAQGALNSGLISYAVDGVQYVAADVGGVTMNPPGITNPLRVGGPLRVKVYALNAKALPAVQADRAPLPGGGAMLYKMVCSACHGPVGLGMTYPTIRHQARILTDPGLLKQFFENVPPPMPKVYPGLLSDGDVVALSAYFRTLKLTPEGGYVRPTSPGVAAWPAIYSVLTHPRCINCHTMSDFPRQADDRHPHLYGVVRGAASGPDAGTGSAIAHCSSCHETRNNPFTGVPGAPDWHLAPLSMAWESKPNVAMTGHQLCTTLKDKKHNGGRELQALLVHVTAPDSLVEWAFDPGTQLNGKPRQPPPLSREAFTDAFRTWVNAGGPCP